MCLRDGEKIYLLLFQNQPLFAAVFTVNVVIILFSIIIITSHCQYIIVLVYFESFSNMLEAYYKHNAY